ncbi:MAG TPA: Cof-type HAD-IIB family hydrolase [Candidatus Tyrphobacter sp.]
MSIDLIALDLDGTLLDPQEQVSQANRLAIAAALAEGVRVVLVTGRGVEAPTQIARDLELALPVICCHGALTKDIQTGRTIGHIPIPLQHAKPMLEYAESQDIDVAVYLEEGFYRLSGAQRYMSDMHGPEWHDVVSFRDLPHVAPTFLRFLGNEAVEAVRTTFADLPLHFKFETWGAFEECAVTSREATKKRALENLCKTYEITRERVLAIGDSRNDVPMLRWAGVGVAMANAEPDVLKSIGRVTAGNADDGVARAIERYVLEARYRERSA